MSDKVYELYKEHEGYPLEESYLYKAFDLMIDKEEDLIPYIEDFRVSDFSDKLLGAYSLEDRYIKINKKLIENQVVNPRLYALHVIRHEMEHARNLKTLYEGRKDIESTIIYYSLMYYALEHGIEYSPNLDNLYSRFLAFNTRLNYETDPGERLADIKASKYMVNLLKNQRDSDDLLIARGMLYYAYTRGYKDNRYYIDSPTYEFLLKTGMYHYHYWLKNRVDKNDYSFDTRITYGLPITNKEYNKDVIHKVKLHKKDWLISKE